MSYVESDAQLSYLKYDPAWGAEPFPSLPEAPLPELIRPVVERYPLKTALISFGQEISYRQFDDLSDRFATALANLGVKKGDRVGTVLPNCAQHAMAFHGIIKAGAVSVPVNVMLQADEMAYIFQDAGVEVVVCLDLLCPVIEMIKGKTDIRQIVSVHPTDGAEPEAWIPPLLSAPKKAVPHALDFTGLLDDYPPRPPEISLNVREDLALIIYTTGTTGVPKGVMQTHFNMAFTAMMNAHDYGLDYNDVALQILPMFHISGYYQMMYPVLYKGGTVVMVPTFDAGEFLKLIARYRTNFLVAPPTLYVGLLNHPDLPNYDLRHFKATIAGAAPVPAELQKRWQEVTGIELNQGWGMTETNGGAILNLPNRKNVNAIGVPRSAEVKIIDGEGRIPPRGEAGEIMFRGPQVAKGYWKNPEETAKTFESDGWLHTGDAGYIGEDGFVYFVERIKDLIVASGYNIAPFEVESILVTHPAVLEAAVIGVPDEYRGEQVKAFVILREADKGKITAEEILEYCKERMATYKRPRIIEFLDALPKNNVGKVLRRELRARR